jgi:hypothetical protein
MAISEPKFLPTQDEIRAACASIQYDWDDEEYYRRRFLSVEDISLGKKLVIEPYIIPMHLPVGVVDSIADYSLLDTVEKAS